MQREKDRVYDAKHLHLVFILSYIKKKESSFQFCMWFDLYVQLSLEDVCQLRAENLHTAKREIRASKDYTVQNPRPPTV